MPGRNFDLWEVASHLIALAVAYALALPIGWNREHEARSAGLRTFPLVAIASCGFVIVAIRVLGQDLGWSGADHRGSHHRRRLHRRRRGPQARRGTSGTATAASLWATGALGAAVGYGLYDIAAILSIVTFATLQLNTAFKG